LTTTGTAAELFYAKQAMFASSPFIISLMSFAFWYYQGWRKGTLFFEKRRTEKTTTVKDKFILTCTTVIYLIFPTLCTQTFQVFYCRRIGGMQYLAADLEEPCYEGRHLLMVVTLGISQLLAFVIGLPALVFIFLHRNKHLDVGGLHKHAVIVRYGLFFGAYKDETYFWEIIITGRKISIIALSVFGPGLGTERQVQMVLAVLLVCISFEIAGDPYKLVDDSFRILSRLEIAALFVQWSTMWGGSMIFASQDPESEGFVIFLSVILAAENIVLILWSLAHLAIAYKSENKEAKSKKSVTSERNSVWDLVSDTTQWVTSQLSSESARQARMKSRTVDSTDPRIQSMQNPLEQPVIELKDMAGREDERDGSEGARAGDRMSAGMQPPPPAPTKKKSDVQNVSQGEVKMDEKKKPANDGKIRSDIEAQYGHAKTLPRDMKSIKTKRVKEKKAK
jgi:hypothetical protein